MKDFETFVKRVNELHTHADYEATTVQIKKDLDQLILVIANASHDFCKSKGWGPLTEALICKRAFSTIAQNLDSIGLSSTAKRIFDEWSKSNERAAK